METPPGTPKRGNAGGAGGYAGTGNMMNRKYLAFDPRAARNAKRPVDRELLENKVLINLTTGYMDPAIRPMGPPRVVPQELLRSKFPGWGAIAATAPKAHPFGVRPGVSMGAWGSGGPPVSMAMGAAGGEQTQAPSGRSTVASEYPSAYASEESGVSDYEELPNTNPKGAKREKKEEQGGGRRKKTRKGRKSRKVKKLKTRSKRK